MPSAGSRQETVDNPWLREFIARPWQETILGQALVKRSGHGFDLCHCEDGAGASLRALRPADARSLANFNAAGEFRPLKSSRDLQTGWIIHASGPEELAEALSHLYPNALADQFALQRQPPPITGYREFTARQSGMYRITTFLTDADLERVIAAKCSSICLKQRLWTSGAIPADSPEAKSAIPCLEPCAILLEAARKEVRALQEADRARGENLSSGAG